MKKKSVLSPLVLLVAAGVLLMASTVGSARAALVYRSENYSAEVSLANMGVSILENGQVISSQNYQENGEWEKVTGELLTNFSEDASVVLGEAYEEKISIKNTGAQGAVDMYVRVILTKSWQSPEGKKNTELAPELIVLNLLTEDNGWVIDADASTRERTVLYYTDILAVGQETPIFCDTIKIDPIVGTKMIKTEKTDAEGTTIVYTYAYDGYEFVVEAEVNAVQSHNAKDAIKSAWGVDVNVAEDGSLSLN